MPWNNSRTSSSSSLSPFFNAFLRSTSANNHNNPSPPPSSSSANDFFFPQRKTLKTQTNSSTAVEKSSAFHSHLLDPTLATLLLQNNSHREPTASCNTRNAISLSLSLSLSLSSSQTVRSCAARWDPRGKKRCSTLRKRQCGNFVTQNGISLQVSL